MTKNIENIVSFPVNAQRNSFFYIVTLTQRKRHFSAENSSVTAYGAAIAGTTLLSVSTTLIYISI